MALVVFWSGVSLAIVLFDHHGQIIWRGMIVALGLHFVISEMLIKRGLKKKLGSRERPYLAHPASIHPLGRKFKDSSFPSSHVSSIVAIMTVICIFHPVLIAPACFLTVGLAFSRVHCGMHYPSDVLAGSVLGVAYGWAAFILVR